jgi:hypothetical protein
MTAPTYSQLYRAQCDLAREGKLGCAIGSREALHKAYRELGRRGAEKRARLRAARSAPSHTRARACLPPGDRE